MTTHHCNQNPALGPVCSGLTDGDLLTSLGYPVRVMGAVCGSPTMMREGSSLQDARMAAWADGAVRLCSRLTPAGDDGVCGEARAAALAFFVPRVVVSARR